MSFKLPKTIKSERRVLSLPLNLWSAALTYRQVMQHSLPLVFAFHYSLRMSVLRQACSWCRLEHSTLIENNLQAFSSVWGFSYLLGRYALELLAVCGSLHVAASIWNIRSATKATCQNTANSFLAIDMCKWAGLLPRTAQDTTRVLDKLVQQLFNHNNRQWFYGSPPIIACVNILKDC